jgi:hypothetical protein
MNIKRLMDLGCYRGMRHRRGLPVRGQRTKDQRAYPQGSRVRSESNSRRRNRGQVNRQVSGKQMARAIKKVVKKKVAVGGRRGGAHPRLVQQHHHHDHRPSGQRPVLGDFRRRRLPRLAQEHAVRRAGGAERAGNAALEYGMKNVDVLVKGPGPAASPPFVR